MKYFSIIVIAFVLSLTTNAQQVNDPNAQVREAKGFNAISVSSSFDVYITQSNVEAVAVSASDSKYVDRIIVEVKGGKLFIRFEAESKFWKNNNNMKLKAYISFKDINNLSISGACDVFANGTIKVNKLDINQSGASDFKGKLDVNDLHVDLSGASDMTVTGSAKNLKITASGACDFRGYELVSEICTAKASGASDIKITVNKELNAHASGASDVRFKGDGVVRDLKSSGSSSVSKG